MRLCNPGSRRLPVLALGTLLLANGVWATDESIYFGDLPVVASVTRLPQPLAEAPGAVTVIDRDMIRASGARNFADLLRLVPGFQVTSPNQESAVVAYHGLSNEEYTPRVQVLIDGRSQYSPLFRSGVNWNLLPVVLDNIDRIEVIRGSNTVSFGSNAYLGVVNIITLDASQTRGWMVSANHGNASIRDQTIRWGGKLGSADMRMTYHQLNDDGFRKMFDGSLGWFDPHDSRHSSVFDLRIDAPLTERDELQVSLSNATDRSQFGRPRSLSDPFRDFSQNSAAVNLEWRRALGDGEETRLRYSHVQDWSSGAYLEGVGYNNVENKRVEYFSRNQTGGESRTDELELQHILKPAKDLRAIWGLGAKGSSLYSPIQFSSSQQKTRSSYRGFGNLEWRPDSSWLVNLGSSLEYDTIASWMFDPRASLSYHLAKGHTLRVIASRAHRSPSLFEAYGDSRKGPVGGGSPFDINYLAAPGLEPERIDTFELGYLGELKPYRASFDLRLFKERSPNRITMVPIALPASSPDHRDRLSDRVNAITPPIPGENVIIHASAFPYGRADAALNLEDVDIQGYEYQLRWQPLESTRLMYGYSYIRTYAHLIDESVIADTLGNNVTKISAQTAQSAPRRSQTAMIIQRLPYDVEASVMYFKSGYMRWLRNSFTSPYERFDWRLAKAFRLGDFKGEVAYTAQLANGSTEGRRNTRVANEMHWFTLRFEY